MAARRKPQQILIPVVVDEGYQAGLVRRLAEYGIKHREIAAEMGINETQFSRWVGRPSADTGRPVSIGIENIVKIEQAILTIRARQERESKKGTKQ